MSFGRGQGQFRGLSLKSRRDVAGQHVASPGETIATCRHLSPEILELSGLISLEVARRELAREPD
ncbi:hypothetical protein A2U01_0054205 [Trifolium medium]|uniref:Uncharacterized protein n=1 Tax=Trifolium medium TaxID=97028 RepID=A0A392RB28_9FABA|nr:hypothetical protein [Trifolium medium]